MLVPLAGKVAIVTGASRGIGSVIAVPTDVTDGVWLCSDPAAFVTGVTPPLDGGQLAQ